MKRLKRYFYAAVFGGLLTACTLWYVVSDSIVDALLSSNKSAAVAAFAGTGTDVTEMDENAEKWDMTTSDNIKLKAIIYRCAKYTEKWAIVVHGYSSCKENMLSYAKAYYQRGYNVLLPDLRCHGESGGDITGMGWLDRMDIIGWIKRITREDAKAEVILHGVSMGAAAVLMTSGEKLCDNVKSVISDCAYTNVYDVIQWQISKNFFRHNTLLLIGGSIITQIKAGYSWKEASALEQVKKSGTPTLFIHGSADVVVPVSMVYELYNAAACPKKLMIVEGASHAGSMRTDYDNYWLTVFQFIKDAQSDKRLKEIAG